MNSQAATPIRAALDRALPLLDLLSANPGPTESAAALRTLLLEEGVSQDDFAAVADFLHQYAIALADTPKASDGPVEEEQLGSGGENSSSSWLAQHWPVLTGGVVAVAMVVGGAAYYKYKPQPKPKRPKQQPDSEQARLLKKYPNSSDTPWTEKEIKKYCTLEQYEKIKVRNSYYDDFFAKRVTNWKLGKELLPDLAQVMGLDQKSLENKLTPQDKANIQTIWEDAIEKLILDGLTYGETSDAIDSKIADRRRIVTFEVAKQYRDIDGHVKARENRLARTGAIGGLENQIILRQRQNKFDKLQRAFELQQDMIEELAGDGGVTQGLEMVAATNLNDQRSLNGLDLSKPCEESFKKLQISLFSNQNQINEIVQANNENLQVSQKQKIEAQQFEFDQQKVVLESDDATQIVEETTYNNVIDE